VCEGADVPGATAGWLTEAKKVGRRLRQPDGCPSRQGDKLCAKVVHGTLVGDPCR
jgi:hypothetical protein